MNPIRIDAFIRAVRGASRAVCSTSLMASCCLALTVVSPVAAQQAAATGFKVLGNPDFEDVTARFSPEERLELAAHINMVMKQYEQAIPMYEALLKRRQNYAEGWIMLAAAYNRVDEPREALDAADIAITLAPYHAHFHLERGIAAFRLGRYAESIKDLKQYVKAYPLNGSSHYYLGLAQAATGENDAAYASLMRARALNPALMLLTDYYLGLLAAQRGQVAVSRQLLAETQRAFEGTKLPIGGLLAQQLTSLDGAMARRMQAAMHESDVRMAPTIAGAGR